MQQIDEQHVKNQFDRTRGYFFDRDKATSNLLLDFVEDSTTVKIDGTPAEVFKKLNGVEWNSLTPSDTSTSKTDLKTTLDETKLIRLSRTIREKVKADERAVRAVPSFYLHLVLGFLQWKDENGKVSKAPLILIPFEVSLDESETNLPLKFRRSGAEPFLNPSLLEKMEQLGIRLPEFPTDPDLAQYFKDVAEVLKKTAYDKQGWSVEREIYLRLFDSPAAIMYADLLEYREEVASHPVFREIMIDANQDDPEGGNGANESDSESDETECYQVYDADSSQIQVIKAVKAGKNVLVEGPPGTGKSQTIVNIIAQLLSMEKTVLFVSARATGLTVVKDMLSEVGLDPFCLELHGEKRDIRHFRATLTGALKSLGGGDEKPLLVRGLVAPEEMKLLEDKLNKYVEVLHKPWNFVGMSPFELIGIVENFRLSLPDELDLLDVPIDTSDKHTFEGSRMPDITDSLNELIRILRLMETAGVTVTQLRTNISEQHKDAIKECHIALNELMGQVNSFDYKESLLEDTLENMAVGAGTFDNFEGAITGKIESIVAMDKLRRLFADRLFQSVSMEGLETDINKLNKIIKNLEDSSETDDTESQGKFPFPLGNRSNNNLQSVYQNAVIFYNSGAARTWSQVRDRDTALEELKDLKKYLENRKAVIEFGLPEKPKIFKKLWDAELIDSNNSKNSLTQLQEILEKASVLFEGPFKVLTPNVDPWFENSEEMSLKELKTQFDSYREEEMEREKKEQKSHPRRHRSVEQWNTFKTKHENDSMLKPFFEVIPRLEGKVKFEDLRQWCCGSVYNSILKKLLVEEEYKILNEFDSERHKSDISAFCEADDNMIKSNAEQLVGKLHDKRADLTKVDEFRRLREYINLPDPRKNTESYLISIRRLLSTYSEFLQKLMPCFIMDPLSVAQYCEPKRVKFDVIVFDEASQIRPEDALGALLRGQQAVVVGDSRQLAPKHTYKESNPDDLIPRESGTDDPTAALGLNSNPIYMESTLKMCNSFTEHALKWHYRSRHESLMNFSNKEFYEKTMRIFPAPYEKLETQKTQSTNFGTGRGLEFIHTKNTYYDGGGLRSRTNEKEAQIVAQWAMNHYKTYGNQKSLGIITCARNQVKTIEKATEALLDSNAYRELNNYFDPEQNRKEPFFVKHVDDIQGIERDVILFSVAFGRAEGEKEVDSHIFVQSFQRADSDRLLNVLITRAKERCVVFANFLPNALRGDTLKKFADFLRHSEETTRFMPSVPEKQDESQDTSDSFEDVVYQFLVEDLKKETKYKDYIVTKPRQFRMTDSEYGVCLGIFDPDRDRYLLGIELDDDEYHAFNVARDRDKTRPWMLKDLGWKIQQVWSMGWYLDPENEKQLLRDAIDFAAAQAEFDQRSTEDNLASMKEVLENANRKALAKDRLLSEVVVHLNKEFRKEGAAFKAFFKPEPNSEDLREDVVEEVIKPRLEEALEADRRRGASNSEFSYDWPDGIVRIEK